MVCHLYTHFLENGISTIKNDIKIGRYLVPETVKYEWKSSDYHE